MRTVFMCFCFVVFPLMAAVASCRHGDREPSETLSGCDDGGDPTSSDESILALAGCGDAEDTSLIAGGIGHIDPNDPDWEQHLAQEQAAFAQAKETYEARIADLEAALLADGGCAGGGSGLLLAGSCPIPEKYLLISMIPGLKRAPEWNSDLSTTQRQTLVDMLHRRAIECRDAFNNGPAGEQDVRLAEAAAMAWDGYLASKYGRTGARQRFGTVLGAEIVEYQYDSGGVEAWKNTQVTAGVEAGSGVKVEAFAGTGGVAHLLTLLGFGVEASATVSAGTKIESSEQTQTKQIDKKATPPVMKRQMRIRVIGPKGDPYVTNIELRNDAEPLLATGPKFAFASDLEHHSPAAEHHEVEQEARAKRAEAEGARRRAEARRVRDAEMAALKARNDELERTILANRDESVKVMANLGVVDWVVSTDGEWLPLDEATARRLEPSLSYLYEMFPAQMTATLATLERSLTALSEVLSQRAQMEGMLRPLLERGLALAQDESAAMDTITQFTERDLQRAAGLCPLPAMDSELLAVDRWIGEVETLAERFHQHVERARALVPEEEMGRWLEERTLVMVRAASERARAQVVANAASCEAVAALHAALSRRMETIALREISDALRLRGSAAAAALARAGRDMADIETRNQVRENMTEGRLALAAAIQSHHPAATDLAMVSLARWATARKDALSADHNLSDEERVVLTAEIDAGLAEAERERDAAFRGDGRLGMLAGHAQDLTARLRDLRAQFVAGAPSRRGAVLDYWRLVVASSGLRMAPECLAEATAALPECWQVVLPPAALAGRAAEGDIERLGLDLWELEENLAKVEVLLR